MVDDIRTQTSKRKLYSANMVNVLYGHADFVIVNKE